MSQPLQSESDGTSLKQWANVFRNLSYVVIINSMQIPVQPVFMLQLVFSSLHDVTSSSKILSYELIQKSSYMNWSSLSPTLSLPLSLSFPLNPIDMLSLALYYTELQMTLPDDSNCIEMTSSFQIVYCMYFSVSF